MSTSDISTLQSSVRLSITGHKLPVLGLGVYLNAECEDACLEAIKHGYRHIDSARIYENEEAVGRAARKSGIPREQIFITSKVWHTDCQYDTALAAVKDSVMKIGSPIDLYLVHSPLGGKVNRLDGYRAVVEAQKQGLVKNIGVSNYGTTHLDEIKAAGLPVPSVNQIELHVLCQQRPLVAYCRANDIVVEAYCPLIKGDFSNEVLQEVSKALQKSPAQILVRWSLQHGHVPLPKSSTRSRIIENADVFDWSIPDDQMAKLDALDRGDAGAVQWNPIHTE